VTHLDDAVPSWQFREIHRRKIAATPARIFEAIRAVTADEILFFRTLTSIRRLGRPMRECILNAPRNAPLLDVAIRGGFFYIADDPPRELVVGTNIGRDVLAAMNFLVTDDGVTTETRVVARTTKARIMFGLYWLLIRAGSGFIRRMWLRAIARRAERA
jgi:hypothetical protein